MDRPIYYGPALPTIGHFLAVCRGGYGVDLSIAHYSEITLRCPYRDSATFAALSWHPLYQGRIQVVIDGRESFAEVHEAIALVLSHQHNSRHQAQVRAQLQRGRQWRERQTSRPGAREVRGETKRSARTPHPAVWDTAAFSWLT